MFEEAKQVEETQDAGDTLGKTREALPSMRKAQAGDSVQLGTPATPTCKTCIVNNKVTPKVARSDF